MKKIFTLLTLALLSFGANAQISSFPATEGFEAAFDTGTNVTFIPNWVGSVVRPNVSQTRIFGDSVNFRSGSKALAATPTSSTPDTIWVNLNLNGSSNLSMSVWAKSVANGVVGTDTRPAIVKCATSIDGGITYSAEALLGDSTTFPNSSTSFSNYTYPFPGNTNNQPNVRLRIVVVRGNGGGQAARFVMDDVNFSSSSVDIFPPNTTSAVINTTSTVTVNFSEAVGTSAENIANYTGISNLVSAVRNGGNDQVTLTFSPALTEGQFYNLTVANVADLAGNLMVAPQNYTLVFNDNTGNVKITEINYNDPGAGTDTLEFIEIKNLDANAIEIGGWAFTSGITYTFPSGSQIAGGEYIVLSRFPYFSTFYSKPSIVWDVNQALNNSGGETITLKNASGATINSVSYSNVAPWDTLANGYGGSLVLCNESADNTQPGSWSASLDLVGQINGLNVYGSPAGPCVTVGIGEVKGNDFALSAYPNPANESVRVSFTSVIRGSYEIKIVDLAGRTLSTLAGNATSGQNISDLEVSSLSSGLYLIVVDSKDGRSQLRFVKQ